MTKTFTRITYFDINNKTFIESMIDEAKKDRDNALTDFRFNQACDEYKIDEDKAMDMLADYDETGRFEREGSGWIFVEH